MLCQLSLVICVTFLKQASFTNIILCTVLYSRFKEPRWFVQAIEAANVWHGVPQLPRFSWLHDPSVRVPSVHLPGWHREFLAASGLATSPEYLPWKHVWKRKVRLPQEKRAGQFYSDYTNQWLLAYHYCHPPRTLGLSNIHLGLYLDG